MRNVFVCLMCAAMLCLFAGTAAADGLYGCIINNTGQAQSGLVTGEVGDELPFEVGAGGTACMNVDDGSYTVATSDGLHSASFSAAFNKKIPYGTGEVYWLVTLQ